MARKKGGGGMEGPNWMDTYGDMITLVLCFFVLLYSMSNMDESKWQVIAQAFATGKGDIINVVVTDEKRQEIDPDAVYVDDEQSDAANVIDFDDFFTYLKESVAAAGLDESVSVEMSRTGVYMKFRDSVFFEGDSDVLLDEGQYIIEVIGDGIRAVQHQIYSIKVSGHTAESSGSSADEWRLSTGRAASVINFMLSLDCCDSEKFQAAGYAKYRPIAPNDTFENRRLNRRVEIVFLRNDIDYNDPAVLQEIVELELGTGMASTVITDEHGEEVDVPDYEAMREEAELIAADRDTPGREYVSKDQMLFGSSSGTSADTD